MIKWMSDFFSGASEFDSGAAEIQSSIPTIAEVRKLRAMNAELLSALKYHQEQTRPIQRTIDVIAKAESM